MANEQKDPKESYLEHDNLRIEYAVLQEEIQAFIPTYAKFKVPSVMEENNSIGDDSSEDIYIELYVPYEYTFAWGDEYIPEGTRFLVASIGANINDMRIIGRYDRNIEVPNPSHKLAQYIIQLIMLKEREQAIFDFTYDNDTRIRCHHARSPIHDDIGNMVPNNYDRLKYELWEGPEISEKKDKKDSPDSADNNNSDSGYNKYDDDNYTQKRYNEIVEESNSKVTNAFKKLYT